MSEIAHFATRESDKSNGLLASHFSSIPSVVVKAYVEAYTQPGDLVVDPFCNGPTILRQTVHAGRRAIGSSHNPLTLRLTRLALMPPTRRQLDAAVAHLGDAPRAGVPFREHIESLYVLRCPSCGQATPADAFVWERDTLALLHTHLQCRHCGRQSVTPTLDDKEVQDRAIEPRGLHYWYTVDRIAPAGDIMRERAQRLLELYTPRNLYALSSLLMKIESLFADDEMQQLLKLVLLFCLENCSNLGSPDSPTIRHRLRPSAQFVERNVWRAFVAAASEFPTVDGTEPLPLTQDVDALLNGEVSLHAALLPLGVNRLVISLPSDCAAMVVTSPPRPVPAFWALSWLWTGWLFGHKVAAPLKPLLRLWRVDWDWYARTMQAAFRALRSLLGDGAPLILAFDSSNSVLIEALALALAGAGYAPETWARQTDTQACRLISRCIPSLPVPPDSVAELADALCAETSDAVREQITARGEPLTWDELYLPVYRRLARSGLLGQCAVSEELPSSPRAFVAGQVQDAMAGAEGLVCLEEGVVTRPARWWLQHSDSLAPPLSTRVEATVHQLLLSTLILTDEALAEEVYRRFPGDLTPEAGLIEICLHSYGQEITPGHWQLRPEDQPDNRAEEVANIRHGLCRLGECLDFEVELRDEASSAPALGRLPAFDVLWRDEGQPAYTFAIQWTARVHDLLLAQVPTGVQPCLVIPGGRSVLVAFKLQRDPRLRRAAAEAGWRFVKYRHLRRILVEENLDRHTLKQIFGLDPIIERDSAQMPLF